ncbi:Flp family type IVb pilin [Parapusillimonas sp. SGNA-6]|nr:Flp family type IVb pilin [Parapusillimonas sp. SGNA-6]
MRKFLKGLLRDERGVSALEYAILAGMIVVIVGGAMTTFGGDLADIFGSLGDSITTQVNGYGQ